MIDANPQICCIVIDPILNIVKDIFLLLLQKITFRLLQKCMCKTAAVAAGPSDNIIEMWEDSKNRKLNHQYSNEAKPQKFV